MPGRFGAVTAPVLERLLAVQDLDTAADRLRHRKETLPEKAELAAVTERAGGLRAQLADAERRLGVVAGRESELEAELTATEQRIADVNRRLYGGEVSASRELQAMADEVKSLEARKSQLEERVLEVMEEREPVDSEVAGLRAEAVALANDAKRLQQAIAAAEAEIDRELADEIARREVEAQSVPSDVLRTYEQLRTRFAGIGVSRLVSGSCTGCHLALPASELARIRHEPDDAIILCDQCGRILVR
jgi:predicted  nucleic acid-binding Zn-ribbon protein